MYLVKFFVLLLYFVAALPVYAAGTSENSASKLWTINQQNSDIREFITQIASITEETFVLDPQIKDNKTVTVISTTPMNKDEIYNIFLEVLSANGFAVIPRGNVKTIVPNVTAKASGGNQEESFELPHEASIVTRVIDLNSVSAIEVIPIIRPLIAQHGHAAASSTGNAVVISDVKSNVDRVHKVIKDLDNSGNIDFEVVQLQYAWVGDIVKLLQENFNTAKGNNFTQLQIVPDERSNRLVIKGNDVKRQRVKKLIKTLDQKGVRQSSARVIFLNHGDATNISEILSDAAQSIGGTIATTFPTSTAPNQARGATPPYNKSANRNKDIFIKADKTTNSLIIIADPDTLLELEKLVRQLDIRRAQVLIQAAIVEISGGIDDAIGLQWGISGTTAPQVGLPNPKSIVTSPLPVLDIGSVALRNANFGVIINALQTQKKTNLLSTPSMLTLDNEEAEFMVGQEIPFETGSYTTGTDSKNPFKTTERKPVGLSLKVTPHIGKNDTLRLKIEQEISALLPRNLQTASAGDVTSQRKIKATVIIDNEQTIVIGGLLQDDVKQTIDKVPFLGDIPLLGYLFTNSVDVREKRNLLLFIRPSIVRSGFDLRETTDSHYSKLKLIHSNQEVSSFYKERTLPEYPDQLFNKNKLLNQPKAKDEENEAKAEAEEDDALD